MNAFLSLRFEHVLKLHNHGIVSLNKVEQTIQRAVNATKAKRLSPKLSELAGLCQRVIVNPEEFKVMLHFHEKQLKTKK
jgi:hypothetical protein